MSEYKTDLRPLFVIFGLAPLSLLLFTGLTFFMKGSIDWRQLLSVAVGSFLLYFLLAALAWIVGFRKITIAATHVQFRTAFRHQRIEGGDILSVEESLKSKKYAAQQAPYLRICVKNGKDVQFPIWSFPRHGEGIQAELIALNKRAGAKDGRNSEVEPKKRS